jgi:endonuclease YncB( thermonuclease family)
MVSATVTKVLSGDTIRVDVGRSVTVRLLGIDAPNSNSVDGVECYAEEATARLATLADGQTVWLEGETANDTDERWNRYLWIPVDGELTLINELLAREGFARAKRTSLDDRYEARLTAASRAARAENTGLWGACSSGSDTTADGCQPGMTRFDSPDGWSLCYNASEWALESQVFGGDTIVSVTAGEIWVGLRRNSLIDSPPNCWGPTIPAGVRNDGPYVDESGKEVVSIGDDRTYTAFVLTSPGGTSVHYNECRSLEPASGVLHITHSAPVDNYADEVGQRNELLEGLIIGGADSSGSGTRPTEEPSQSDSQPSGDDPEQERATEVYTSSHGWSLRYDPATWTHNDSNESFLLLTDGVSEVWLNTDVRQSEPGWCLDNVATAVARGLRVDGPYVDERGDEEVGESSDRFFAAYLFSGRADGKSMVRYTDCRVLPSGPSLLIIQQTVVPADLYPAEAAAREDLLIGLTIDE